MVCHGSRKLAAPVAREQPAHVEFERRQAEHVSHVPQPLVEALDAR